MMKLVLVAALAAIATSASVLLSAAPPQPGPALAAADPDPAPPRGGDGVAQQVGVRGVWTIEVRDPDGTFVSRNDFHNAYHDQGNAIVRTLAGQNSAGSFVVYVNNGCGVDAPSGCVLAQVGAAEPQTGVHYWHTLTATTGASTVSLQGSFIAERDASIGIVFAGLQHCTPDIPPASCVGQEFSLPFFTRHELSPQVAVIGGQQVLVKVEITFGPVN